MSSDEHHIAESVACICSPVYVGMKESGARNLNFDCPVHGEPPADYVALAGTALCVCEHRACHHNGPIYATLTGSRARGCDDCGCAYFCPSGERTDDE